MFQSFFFDSMADFQSSVQYQRLREQVLRASRDVRDVALLFGSTPSRNQGRTDLFLMLKSLVEQHLRVPESASGSKAKGQHQNEILVVPYGSHLTGLVHAQSDLDVTIVLNRHAECFRMVMSNIALGPSASASSLTLENSADALVQESYAVLAQNLVELLQTGILPVSVQVLGSTHCPRIRLRHLVSGIEADITFGNVVAVASSIELQQYVLEHPSIVPLYQFLHALMRERQVERSQMSSYVLALITVAFFRYHTKSINSPNSTPGQSLLYFLHTFRTSGIFDPVTMCLSPSHPDGILQRDYPAPACGWMVHCPIRGATVNVASSCYLVFQVRDIFEQTYELLSNNYFGGSLEDGCGAPGRSLNSSSSSAGDPTAAQPFDLRAPLARFYPIPSTADFSTPAAVHQQTSLANDDRHHQNSRSTAAAATFTAEAPPLCLHALQLVFPRLLALQSPHLAPEGPSSHPAGSTAGSNLKTWGEVVANFHHRQQHPGQGGGRQTS